MNPNFLFGILSLASIGSSIALFRVMSVAELPILIMAFGICAGIIAMDTNDKSSKAIWSAFIALIIGSVIVSRRSDWITLFKKDKSLTVSVAIIMFVCLIAVGIMSLTKIILVEEALKGKILWNHSRITILAVLVGIASLPAYFAVPRVSTEMFVLIMLCALIMGAIIPAIMQQHHNVMIGLVLITIILASIILDMRADWVNLLQQKKWFGLASLLIMIMALITGCSLGYYMISATIKCWQTGNKELLVQIKRETRKRETPKQETRKRKTPKQNYSKQMMNID